jgi:hypothetical protein
MREQTKREGKHKPGGDGRNQRRMVYRHEASVEVIIEVLHEEALGPDQPEGRGNPAASGSFTRLEHTTERRLSAVRVNHDQWEPSLRIFRSAKRYRLA